MTSRGPKLVARLRAAGCVYAEAEARLLEESAGTDEELKWLVNRRLAGEPLEQVLGWAEFHGLRVRVEPGVFVPRRRTELVVDEALRWLAHEHTPRLVLELCCGSGAVGLAIAAAAPDVEVHASDQDDAAVRCARRNLAPVGGIVHQGDLYAAVPGALRGRVGVIAANPPYVPTGAVPLLPPEARDHEPWSTLDGGADGLAPTRRIAAEAAAWLAPEGALVLETSDDQADAVVAALAAGGLQGRVVPDADAQATVVVAHRSQPTR